MSPRHKLALAAIAISLYVVAGLALLVAAIGSDLRPDETGVLDRVLEREATLAVFLGALLLLGLAFLVGALLRPYLQGPRRLASEAELIAAANPAHRLEPRGPAELRDLAEAVNALAERAERNQGDVAGQIAAARTNLEQERDRLAALMSELTLAVLVCNAGGRILLYNPAAKELLARDDSAAPVGLGRSLFGFLDRGLVGHALERLEGGADEDAPRDVRLSATTAGGRLLRVAVGPVRDRDGALTGFVLILEDVTEVAEEGSRRDALLRALTEGTRASVGSMRAAVENMREYPGMDPESRERFLAIVHDEAVSLSVQVEAALRDSPEWLAESAALEEVLDRDLAEAARRAVEREAGVAAEVEGGGDELWLRADSFALVRALGHLARRLREANGVERFSLRLDRSGAHARLDLAWEGASLAAGTLRAWSEEPLAGGPAAPGAAATLGQVLERHGAEAWPESDAGGSAWVRLLLPAAEGEAARRPPPRPRGTAEGRPEFYDFDLFGASEWGPERDGAQLGELAYTVFDTETTGLVPENDEIVSIGAVRIVNGRLLRGETFDRLVDPGRSISAASVSVHGISDELVAGEPSIDRVLPLFARFAEDTVLVGHNVGFDLRFLELKRERTGVRLTQPVLDTLLLSALSHPEDEDHSLEAIAARLGVSTVGRHTALGDAILTAEVFLGQLRLLVTRGVETLGQAREAARKTYLARVSDSLYSGN